MRTLLALANGEVDFGRSGRSPSPSKGAELRDILIDLDGEGHGGSASAGDDDLAQK